MQSSAMVALRTMIMLTCLVAVPLVAVLGTALPKVVQSAFDGQESSLLSGGKAASEAAPTANELKAADSQAAAPSSIGAGPTDAEPAGGTELPRLPIAHITGVRAMEAEPAALVQQEPAEPEIETAPLWDAPTRTASSPRDRNMTAHFAPSQAPHGLDAARRTRSEPRTEALQKTAYSQPDEEPASAGDARLVPVERPATDNALAESERRLRQLGATYYRLETWGDDAQFYRCSCNIALAPRGRATRHFEAIEAAPSQAIDAVVEQIGSWRARRTTR
jgi:hypothetical protein